MDAQYEITLHPTTRGALKAQEIQRIDELFTKIERRYWDWKKLKRDEGIKGLMSIELIDTDKEIKEEEKRKKLFTEEEAEAFFDEQREGDAKGLVRIFQALNAHYIRLYPYVQEFNNTDIQSAIAEDKRQYKEFNSGLASTTKIALKYEDNTIKDITIWFGSKHKSSLSGLVNGYILEEITNRLPTIPYPCTVLVSTEDSSFDEIRSVIQEETAKHRFEDRYTPKSNLQPIAERCSDLYSDFIKHKEWIFDKKPTSGSYSKQAGKMIIELLGLRFPEATGFNKQETFINALHPIRYVEIRSWPTMIDISPKGLI